MTEGKGKILVVDDEVPVAEMLAEHLTELGYQVISAHCGIEALSKLDLEKPHVILLDAPDAGDGRRGGSPPHPQL